MVNQDKLHVWEQKQIEEKAQELYYKWNGSTCITWSARSEELKQDYRKVAVKHMNAALMTRGEGP